MPNEILTWSGCFQRYNFEKYPINTSFADVDGNYIFAKEVNPSYYEAIYIGEGNLKDRIVAHIKDGCVTKKGATHIFAHTNSNANNRKSEEEDLLCFNTEAYAPKGCNIKEGG
jgi:hypothetical protein